jgi:hypothetical protein
MLETMKVKTSEHADYFDTPGRLSKPAEQGS